VNRSITIVGGGLAGLTLGILLRKSDVPVEVWEAGRYPRHRVCGEFISGRGVSLLQQLDINHDLPRVESTTVRFFANGRATRVMKLPRPALCIARHDLDHRLAREFTALGGRLRAGDRWTESFAEPGIIRATGRRVEKGVPSPFVGLKVHANNLPLDADLELHFSRAGYAGLCQLPSGAVNVCGLFRAREGASRPTKNAAEAFLPILGNRLAGADIDPATFCSVAAISIGRAGWDNPAEFRLGDSIAVIPPLTGNGMSLAIESAFLAAEPLAAFSRGLVAWPQAIRDYSQVCKEGFRRRVQFSAFLQKLLLERGVGQLMLSCFRTVPGVFRILYKFTH
jgi:2-polyprenyl-6-methoxyphenol hydroxylase-like FAD-dependent oxidoreductase